MDQLLQKGKEAMELACKGFKRRIDYITPSPTKEVQKLQRHMGHRDRLFGEGHMMGID